MSTLLTPGRWRGLKTTSLKEKEVFGIVAFDQRGSYRRMLPDDTPYADAVALKEQVVYAMTLHATAILLDPSYGLGPAMKMTGRSGLVMAVEKSGYSGEDTYRRPIFEETWTPEKIRNMGASAVKLLVYYNPQAEELANELDELVREKVAECHAYDLPVFLEPMSYSIDADVKKSSAEYAAQKRSIVVETARRLSKTGADVLKMEFPYDHNHESDHGAWQDGCAELSEACAVPWVLLSAGVNFETFEQQTEVACKAGASGFLAGRAIWKEVVDTPVDERDAFLSGTATDRLKTLLEIAGEYSRPWSEFYTAPQSSERWFDTYQE